MMPKVAILFVCAGCAAAADRAALVQCAGEAVLKVLPADPEQTTIADVKDIQARVTACHGTKPDGGGAR